MAKDSAIEWTHHTFNIVWGCLKISPGCEHCYAETLAKRYGHDVWGPAKTTERRTMSESYWKQPLIWNKVAKALEQRQRVFCSSMADVFEDHPTNNRERPKLWRLIEETPWLDWLLLTKRPENISTMIADDWLTGGFPRNIWLGTSAENQRYLESRWDTLQSETHYLNPSVLFLSLEPLLGPIDLRPALEEIDLGDEEHTWWTRPVDWVIVGGESGPNARPMHPGWVRSLRNQCQEAGVPFLFKQWGEYYPTANFHSWTYYLSKARNRDFDRLIAADGFESQRSNDYERATYPLAGVKRVGKKAAGRLLDGSEWNGFPAVERAGSSLELAHS